MKLYYYIIYNNFYLGISDVGLLPGQGIPERGGKSYYSPFCDIPILTLSILSTVTLLVVICFVNIL